MKHFAKPIKYSLLILLAAGSLLFIQNNTSEAASLYFRTAQDYVPVYDNRTGT